MNQPTHTQNNFMEKSSEHANICNKPFQIHIHKLKCGDLNV